MTSFKHDVYQYLHSKISFLSCTSALVIMI
jgi:hypothetical protein